MDRKTKSRFLIGCTGAALAFGLTASALSGSAALGSGAFFVKSVNDENPAIAGIAGMNGNGVPGSPGGPSNPGGNPGTETPPAIQDPTPASATVPTVTNAYYIFTALGSDRIRSLSHEITSQGEVTNPDNSTPILQDGAGTNREGYVGGFDMAGNTIAVSSWWDASNRLVDGAWRQSGSGYQFLGSITRTEPRANGSFVTSPDGSVYHLMKMSAEIKVSKSVGGKLEPIRTVSTPAEQGFTERIAVSDRGTVAAVLGNRLVVAGEKGELGSIPNARSVAPLRGGGFAVGTDTGIVRISEQAKILDSTSFGKPVLNLNLGANGRLSYMVGDPHSGETTELRTLDPSGKQTLWAYNTTRVD